MVLATVNDIGLSFFLILNEVPKGLLYIHRLETGLILFSYNTPEYIISLRQREREKERECTHFIIPSIHLFVPLGRKLKPF